MRVICTSPNPSECIDGVAFAPVVLPGLGRVVLSDEITEVQAAHFTRIAGFRRYEVPAPPASTPSPQSTEANASAGTTPETGTAPALTEGTVAEGATTEGGLTEGTPTDEATSAGTPNTQDPTTTTKRRARARATSPTA